MINTFHSPTVSMISEVTQSVDFCDDSIYFLGFYCLNTKLLLKRENNWHMFRQAALPRSEEPTSGPYSEWGAEYVRSNWLIIPNNFVYICSSSSYKQFLSPFLWIGAIILSTAVVILCYSKYKYW